MTHSIECASPWFIALLAALLFLPLVLRRSLAGFGRAQRITCVVIRALLLALIVLALAGVRALLPSSDVGVIFAVDASASISPEAAKAAREFVASALHSRHAGDTAGVVGFARVAQVWQSPQESLALGEWPQVADAKATDIGHALDFSSALFPGDQSRRVVLLSDGNDTSGHALEAATRLARSGVEVWTVPLRTPEKPEVLASTRSGSNESSASSATIRGWCSLRVDLLQEGEHLGRGVESATVAGN